MLVLAERPVATRRATCPKASNRTIDDATGAVPALTMSFLLEVAITASASAPSVTDWIGAIASISTTLIAGGALIYAAIQVAEAKRSRGLTRELEVERAQPYVVAYTEPSAASQMIIDLVVKNYGPTAARDVKLSISPWPVRSDGSEAGERVAVPEVIPILAPGQEWRTMWDSGLERQETSHPDRHEGMVTFVGLNDFTLSSPVILDWSIYKTRQWVEVRGIHDAAKALREINERTKKWHEVNGGLRVMVRDGDKKDEHAREAAAAWRAERSAAESSNAERIGEE